MNRLQRLMLLIANEARGQDNQPMLAPRTSLYGLPRQTLAGLNVVATGMIAAVEAVDPLFRNAPRLLAAARAIDGWPAAVVTAAQWTELAEAIKACERAEI